MEGFLKFVMVITAQADTPPDILETAMMYTNAQHALCLFRCKNDRLTSMRPPLNNPSIFEEFQNRKPYQYLQICYWKVAFFQNNYFSIFNKSSNSFLFFLVVKIMLTLKN